MVVDGFDFGGAAAIWAYVREALAAADGGVKALEEHRRAKEPALRPSTSSGL